MGGSKSVACSEADFPALVFKNSFWTNRVVDGLARGFRGFGFITGSHHR